tara:strand:- start:170 stop:724 length:555 start_codon:yes stop_codon:yes gene_type:complete
MYPFFTIDDFPELKPVQDSWKEIRDEVITYLDSFYKVEDERNTTGRWFNLPISPASDDMALDRRQGGNLDKKVDKWKDEFPRTRELCSNLTGVNEFVFSLLGPDGHIGSHSHGRNCVSAVLGLDVPDYCTLRVKDKTEHYENGKFVIFNFREKHEAWNQSDRDRLVLLISLPNRHEQSGYLRYL